MLEEGWKTTTTTTIKTETNAELLQRLPSGCTRVLKKKTTAALN